jgi:DNA-binding transcriptional ArsR family regulator
MARRKEMITLKDPRGLRALAHPARQRLITELFSGRVLTATQAAEMVDLTPSAVSHHLRALEKWGLARRTSGSGDGRERPWEATARKLTLEPSDATGSLAALHSVAAAQLQDLSRNLDAFVAGGPDRWRDAYPGLSRADVWLTEEETREVTTSIESMIQKYSRRNAAKHPKDARRASFTWSLIPLEAPPDTL